MYFQVIQNENVRADQKMFLSFNGYLSELQLVTVSTSLTPTPAHYAGIPPRLPVFRHD